MREIKFRAWHPTVKRMSVEFSLSDAMEHDVDKTSEDEIYLQFTGLSDVNGFDIYEGDIVVKKGYLWFDDEVPNYVGTVEWVFSQWQVIAHCINPLKSGISDGMNYGMNDEGIEENKNSEWEIIGNIYENPELLK